MDQIIHCENQISSEEKNIIILLNEEKNSLRVMAV